MALTYCAELTGIDSLPQSDAAGNVQGARRHRYRATIALTAQVTGDILIAIPQIGEVFEGARTVASATLGSTTFGIIGLTSGNTYVATGQTSTGTTPVSYATPAALALPALVQADRIVLRTAAATLPGSGTLVVDLFFSQP